MARQSLGVLPAGPLHTRVASPGVSRRFPRLATDAFLFNSHDRACGISAVDPCRCTAVLFPFRKDVGRDFIEAVDEHLVVEDGRDGVSR